MANPTDMEYFARNFSAFLASKELRAKSFLTTYKVPASGATVSGWMKARWMPGQGEVRDAVTKALGHSFEKLTSGYCIPGANKLAIKEDGYAQRQARAMRAGKKAKGKRGNGHDTGLDALATMEANPNALAFKLGQIKQTKGDNVKLTLSVEGDFFAVAQFATALHRVIE